MSDPIQVLSIDRAAEAELLSDELLRRMDAYWRAANYLSVGQIYLLDNPLLRQPLTAQQTKPRLLGHWGTTPGLNFVYVHLNRAIVQRDLNVIYVCGPGHGGPGMVANAYLEGTYSELYSGIGQDENGLKLLFKQFSFPGGIPSHDAPRHRAPSTKAASLATPSRTRTAPRSITPTCSWPAWWVTAKRRPVHSRRRGTPTSSSIQQRMGRSCRSST
jgi:hypothetical protein